MNRRTFLNQTRTWITLAVTLSGVACGSTSQREPPKENNADGRPPTRVVVLDPGMSEVFIHLGLVPTLVGRPQYTDHMPELSGVSVVGTGITPNYEAIVRANPQLILTHATRGKSLSDLNSIAPTRDFTWLSVADVAQDTRTIGQLMGVSTAANVLAEEIEQGLEPKIHAESPTVLMLLGPPSETSTELWYAKRNSLHGAALEAAGGVNAVIQRFEGPPSLSIEALLKIDPDVILVMVPDATPGQLAGHRAFWARLGMLKAVQKQHIGLMTGREHFSTGPRVLRFKEAIVAEFQRLGIPTP
jgi:ABC-type Fe3+-hydroxamate transport system substrate-binding protein